MKVIDEISKSFNKVADHYEQAAIVQNEIGKRLLERLEYIRLNPRWILDLGCGGGNFSQQLQKYYPKARIVSLDLALQMLQQVKKRQRWWRKWPLVCADMHQLPFATGTFDLIFSNQVLHWSSDIPAVLKELARIMNVNACLMFSTLGPDTFREIRETYAKIDSHAHINEFTDMHDLGDYMLKANLLDPVVDMEYLHVHYSSIEKLMNSLKSQGVKNIHSRRNKGLSGRNRIQYFKQLYHDTYQQNGKYPLTYEIVYAHAWQGAPRQTSQEKEIFIPVSMLKRTL